MYGQVVQRYLQDLLYLQCWSYGRGISAYGKLQRRGTFASFLQKVSLALRWFYVDSLRPVQRSNFVQKYFILTRSSDFSCLGGFLRLLSLRQSGQNLYW